MPGNQLPGDLLEGNSSFDVAVGGELDGTDEGIGFEVDTSGLAAAESRALEERFRNLGFHEGYDAAKEERLQEGFEAGYMETFALSKEIGALVGKIAMKTKLADEESDVRNSAATTGLEESVKWLVRERLTSPDLCTGDLQCLKRRLEDEL